MNLIIFSLGMAESVSELRKPHHCGIIQRNLLNLCECIDVRHSGLFEALIQKGAFSRDEIKEIQVKSSSLKRTVYQPV